MYIYIKQTDYFCCFKLKMNPGETMIMIMHTDGKENTICSWELNYIYQFQYKENVLAEPQGSAEHSLMPLPYRDLTTKCVFLFISLTEIPLLVFICDWSEDGRPLLQTQNAVKTCAVYTVIQLW